MILSDLISSLVRRGASPATLEMVVAAYTEVCGLDAQAAKRQDRNRRYHARKDVSVEKWRSLRKAVFERDGFVCVYCGEAVSEPHCDHIVPLVAGGASVMENLATACPKCNGGKSGRTPSEWRLA